jgi:hypothetical protein
VIGTPQQHRFAGFPRDPVSTTNRQRIANRQHQESYFADFLDVSCTNMYIGARWLAAYSISSNKAEKEIDLIQEAAKLKDKRTSTTMVPSILRSFAIFETPLYSHWSLP